MNDSLCGFDATTTARMIAAREVSAREVIDAHVKRIDSVNSRLNAIVRRDDAAARQAADAA